MKLTAITDTTMTPGHKTVRYAYDAKGRLQTVTYANGARQDYAYNSDNRLERLTTRGAAGSLINDHIYRYTPGGILTEISAYQNGSAYQCDALNQVTNETTFITGGQSGPLYARRAYEYDANGNRTRETRTDVLPNGQTPAVTRGYGSATADDRITSFWDNTPGNPSTSFDYDARGNRLRRTSHVQGQTSFGYDAFSRMTGITNGAVSVEYTYDSLGRKVQRVKRDTTIYPDGTYYVYDGLDPVCVIRFNPASTECTTVTWLLRGVGVAPGIGNIVAQQRYTINFSGAMSQPVTHYYHPNHRGDTAYLTDAAGVIPASYVYDAFGRLLTATNSALTVYRFSSKEWDPDAQLYYFGFRWYDPDTGAWTAKDPLGFGGLDENVYRFCLNNGIILFDPYGLSWKKHAQAGLIITGSALGFAGTVALTLTTGPVLVPLLVVGAGTIMAAGGSVWAIYDSGDRDSSGNCSDGKERMTEPPSEGPDPILDPSTVTVPPR